jgi:hypothetical protein
MHTYQRANTVLRRKSRVRNIFDVHGYEFWQRHFTQVKKKAMLLVLFDSEGIRKFVVPNRIFSDTAFSSINLKMDENKISRNQMVAFLLN